MTTCTLSQLSQAEVDFAAMRLNENAETRSVYVDEMREWIAKSGDLNARTDESFILSFLRNCKFDVDKTKRKFRSFHEMKTLSPDWFANRDPFLPVLQQLFSLGVFLPLRKTNETGSMIVIIRACVHNPKVHTISNVLKASMMILDVATRDNKSVSLYGIVAVIDLKGVSLGHALQLTPSLIKRLVHSWQGCYPIRIVAVEFINAPFHVNMVLNIFRSFMSEKLKSRVDVHTGDMRTISSKVPPSVLPFEYGGTEGSLENLKEYWKGVVEENQRWLIEDEAYKLAA